MDRRFPQIKTDVFFPDDAVIYPDLCMPRMTVTRAFATGLDSLQAILILELRDGYHHRDTEDTKKTSVFSVPLWLNASYTLRLYAAA